MSLCVGYYATSFSKASAAATKFPFWKNFIAASRDLSTSAILGALGCETGGRTTTGSAFTGGSGFTGSLEIGVFAGFAWEGAFVITAAFPMALATGFDLDSAGFFAGIAAGFAIGFFSAVADLEDFGTVAPVVALRAGGDDFAFATGFADFATFGAFDGATADGVRLTPVTGDAFEPDLATGIVRAAGAFFTGTAFFTAVCFVATGFEGAFAVFAPTFAGAFAGADFFKGAALDTVAFVAEAFVEGLAFTDATGTRATARLFEVLLMEGVTDFLGADFFEPAFAGEFLIESLCFTIL